ncbi:hypothetical protein SELMODRAFT_414063 [Selaginella moellendorffii]|uniref:Uncharacterized protein n=1 Tax=Selaginella moellendorffii TaxID=88036 RepID=D8RRI4_SELML|nr:hypothetical protein SELMODRAFT_414063 [Selaginella moellendorffii]
MTAVEAAQLSSPRMSVRVRVPTVESTPGPWLDYMGRPCFLDALAFVEKQQVGDFGCIAGAAGLGKSFLLATLAAFLAFNRPEVAVVYIEGAYFAEAPLETLLLGLSVSYGRNEAALAELVDIETWEAAMRWLEQRQEAIYFFVNRADTFAEKWALESARKYAVPLLATGGATVIYAAKAPLCLGRPPSSVFQVPPGFVGMEMHCFLEKRGPRGMDFLEESVDLDSLWYNTGGVPSLLECYASGSPNLWLDRHLLLLDGFLKQPLDEREWRLVLKALSGCKMPPPSDAVYQLMGKTGCVLFMDGSGMGDCLSRFQAHLSFRSLQLTSLDLEEVLDLWLWPVMHQTSSSSSSGRSYSWNCLMALATVIKLRKRVHLEPVRETMVVNSVKLEAPSWMLPHGHHEQMLLDEMPMNWPRVLVNMPGKTFVIGLDEDFASHHETRAANFMSEVTKACDVPYHVYFIWIGFGDRVPACGVVCNYDHYTDVFMGYGAFDSALAALDRVIPAATQPSCHYMPLGKQKACTLYTRRRGGILCHLHSSMASPQQSLS